MIPPFYQGSVKDLLGPVPVYGIRKETDSGVVFRFTDAYSAFDWGKMPDELPDKGKSLAIMGAHIFEKLEDPETWKAFSKTQSALAVRKGITQLPSEAARLRRKHGDVTEQSTGSAFNELGERFQKEGLRTHYLGAVRTAEAGDYSDGALAAYSMDEVGESVSHMAVREVKVVHPKTEYVLGRQVMNYQDTRESRPPKLIPLEIVFRYGCPEGSSLLKRVKENPQYLAQLPVPQTDTRFLKGKLEPGSQWDFPIVELTTKLESSDRELSFTEALAISGMKASQLQEVFFRTIWVSAWLKHTLGEVGLELWDGKLEWALGPDGEIWLVDSIGPDELRVTHDGIQLSKQFLRNFYDSGEWYQNVQSAKKAAKTQGVADWKKLVSGQPPHLTPEYVEVGSQMYRSLTHLITGKSYFNGVWSLEKVIQRIRELKNDSNHSSKSKNEAVPPEQLDFDSLKDEGGANS